ncbi:MAG: hypothetical protein GXP25_20000 [Planctomycetes bacterium]|nr:hypothetical protein [Planctomycetota bacterium]
MEENTKRRPVLDTVRSVAVLVCLWVVLDTWAYVDKRAYYEDEIMSLHVVQKSFTGILRHTYHKDYHPFGYYFYLKALFSVFGSNKAIAFAGSMALTAVALSLLFLTFLNLGGRNRSLAVLVLALNPMFLLHGSAARWYPLWTALAAGALYTLTRKECVSWAALVAASTLVALAAYVNYITVVLGAGIVLWLLSQREFRKALVFVLIVGVLFAPWLPAFHTHLTHSTTQFMRGSLMRIKSFAYVGFCLLLGQTISPWRIAPWIVGGTALAPLLALSVTAMARDKRRRLIVLLLVVVMAFCLLCRYQRARSLMFFSGVLSLYVALAVETVRPRRVAAACLILVFGCNAVALANLKRGVHYHKKGLSDPVPAVMERLQSLCQRKPTVVLTTNLPLTYCLSRSGICEMVSPFEGYAPVPIAQREQVIPTQVVMVHSYLGSLYAYKDDYEAFREQARVKLGKPATIFQIKKDLDLEARERIFAGTTWPEYRFTIEVYRGVKPQTVAEVTGAFREIWTDRRKPYVPAAE